MAKPLEFIQPKNKNAKKVDWNISPAQRIGLTDKVFDFKDIIYMS
jgi:hypothetical protein